MKLSAQSVGWSMGVHKMKSSGCSVIFVDMTCAGVDENIADSTFVCSNCM